MAFGKTGRFAETETVDCAICGTTFEMNQTAAGLPEYTPTCSEDCRHRL
jgi:endogenous inhibitor of DNA gyrase (YacG/DUF329 family)